MEAQNQIQRNFQIITVFMLARASKAPYHRMRVKGGGIIMFPKSGPIYRQEGKLMNWVNWFVVAQLQFQIIQ